MLVTGGIRGTKPGDGTDAPGIKLPLSALIAAEFPALMPPVNPPGPGFFSTGLVGPMYPPAPPMAPVAFASLPGFADESRPPRVPEDGIPATFVCPGKSVAPPFEFGGAALVSRFEVAPELESMRVGLPDPFSSGAVVTAGRAMPTGVNLKLILKALFPQSISPPVNMKLNVLGGVDVQFPPGI